MPAISDPAIDRMVGNISRETINRFLSSKDSNYKPSQKVFENGQSNAGALFPTAFRDTFQSFSICGYSTVLNLFVFLIRLKRGKSLGERSCRKLQFDYAKTILRKDQGNFIFHDALTDWLRESKPFILSQAIFIFADEQQRFRFSLVENADINTMTANRFRRYTFYVDPAATNRTFIDRMAMDWSNFDKIKVAFSVEKLSDEFFDEYKRIYQDFVEYATGKSMVKQGNKWVEVKTHEPVSEIMDQFAQFGDGEKAFRDYVKKMMGRLVFLQFLQKKGWLGVPESGEWGDGDRNYLQKLFNGKSDAEREDFLDSVLEPLFFNTLNTDRSNTGDVAANILSIEQGKKIRIPYLNGGLFEEDALDKTKVKFPPEKFGELFETFDRFNFTIDENDPEDAEIGVDPEMLGRIFENLLEDNKDKGAFYTPKEIVGYMCRESLIQYLGDTEENRKLVTELDAEAIPPDRKKPLIEKLKAVKVCDPAIGSGAFPMGMLNLLLKLRIKLGDVDDSSEGILAAKKEIIQNNLYGVDIDAGAVDIARLRFWLSIVVDETEPTPLPNFDYKIMQGNSLLESFMGVDLSRINPGQEKVETKKRGRRSVVTQNVALPQQKVFDLFGEGTTIDDILDDMSRFFSESDHKKRDEVRKRIHDNIITLICKSADNDESIKEEKRTEIKEKARQLELKNAPFFLWHLYFADVFGVNGGFDIVIGNPPYVDSETMTKIDEISGSNFRQMYHDLYSTCRGNWDLFIAFIDAGLSLGHDRSSLSFIVPNKLIAAKYADLARVNLTRNHLLEIRDYSSVDVFSGIAVYPCTFIAKKGSPSRVITMRKMEDKEHISFSNSVLYSKFSTDSLWDKYFYSKSTFDLIIKLSSFPSLIEQFPEISGAATVGEAYKIKEIVEDIPSGNDSSHLKLVNTGTIDKFHVLWGQQSIRYLGINAMHPVLKDVYLKEIVPNRYVQAKSHKIIIAGMSTEIEAYYDDGNFLAGKSTTIILQNSCNDNDFKALTAILNSRLISFWIRKNYNSLAMSGGYLNIGVNEISGIPIPEMSTQTIDSLATLCDRFQSEDCNDIKLIDDIVYKLYGLTPEEIDIVEKSFEKTENAPAAADTASQARKQEDNTEDDDSRS